MWLRIQAANRSSARGVDKVRLHTRKRHCPLRNLFGRTHKLDAGEERRGSDDDATTTKRYFWGRHPLASAKGRFFGIVTTGAVARLTNKLQKIPGIWYSAG